LIGPHPAIRIVVADVAVLNAPGRLDRLGPPQAFFDPITVPLPGARREPGAA
jgi:hypothetical protein